MMVIQKRSVVTSAKVSFWMPSMPLWNRQATLGSLDWLLRTPTMAVISLLYRMAQILRS